MHNLDPFRHSETAKFYLSVNKRRLKSAKNAIEKEILSIAIKKLEDEIIQKEKNEAEFWSRIRSMSKHNT